MASPFQPSRTASRLIRTLTSADGEGLDDLLGQPLDSSGLDRARDVVRSNGAVTTSLETAASYASSAIESLGHLDDGAAADRLRDAAHHLLTTVEAAAA